MSNYYKIFIKITFLLVQLIQAFGNATEGACKSLISSATTNFACKYNNTILHNCINPIKGTELFISCNQFYEEDSLENNPNRFCTENGWNDLIPECYLICGKKRTKEISNSLNNQSTLLDYPWHVGIYNNTKHFLCGGTIIEMNIILTAAHCVAHYLDNGLLPSLLVASGKYYNGYDDQRDAFAQFSEAQSIEVPQEYQGNDTFFAFNIAILILKHSFFPSSVVMPICLDFHRLPHHIFFEDKGLITGWGSSFHGNGKEFSEELKEIEVLHKPNNKCTTKIQDEFVKYITPDKICENILNNKTSICHGDNGGGLVFKNPRTKRYFIRGVVSWPPTTTCNPNQFSIFTSIIYHKDFINSYTEYNQTMYNCHLPDFPPHGKYIFKNPSDTNASLSAETYIPGHEVPPYTELTIICKAGYNRTLSRSTEFYCSKYGHWNPNPGGCHSSYTKPQAQEKMLSPLDRSGGFNDMYVILLVAIAVLFIIALIALTVLRLKFNKERKLKRELKLTGLDRFQQGDLKKFNPELGIGSQAELLPYNYNYEFQIDKLQLGMQLGSGAFGNVMKAYAYGIISNEEKTRVAVKTVKDIGDKVQIKSLISELKILIHLGPHLNVVNLLGACTQNITSGKLFIIVEYCPHGNLYDYLLSNRPNYVNQIDPLTGNIDYSLGLEASGNMPFNSSNTGCVNSAPKTYNRSLSECSRMYKKSAKPLYTKDLISWSFQIARGMEYLSSRMIIHGDLAARNVLLAENNIVKICDFGLAKRLYQNVNYKTSKDCPLPIKWMAIESIRDLVFSTQSDVWSYGIVLWELFSLAQTPYPGIEADERLYNKLSAGYKMESPPNAPKEIYKIMCDCWNIDPVSRPSFNKLAGTVGLLLEENVRQHYIDLNDPYFAINTQRLNEGQTDYLTMLSHANFHQKSFSSNYITRIILKDGTSVVTLENSDMTPTYLNLDNCHKISKEEEMDSSIEIVRL